MEHIARVELGMRSDEFYLLAWYDWCLWIDRIHELQRQRLYNYEIVMDLGRRLLSQYWNWNRGKKQPTSPEDFWKLSWDKENERTDTQMSPEDQEALKETIERLERAAQKRINKRRGG